MKVTVHTKRWSLGVPHQEVTLDAETIEFLDGGDVYTIEEIRTVMRNRRRDHTRKLDEDKS
jgi:hypothetical protein